MRGAERGVEGDETGERGGGGAALGERGGERRSVYAKCGLAVKEVGNVVTGGVQGMEWGRKGGGVFFVMRSK